jgi:LysR family glycine cleavage system transcriptional activator
MPRLPPLTELRVFEAAARLGSFQRAAVELSVTPTAVSHQVRLLERSLGVALFRRRPRPMTLTDAGARLLPGISDGLAAFARAVELVRATAADAPLTVTTTNAFAARWLIPRLPDWRERHPDLPLQVIGTDSVVDLHAGEAQLAIRYARLPPEGLVSDKLCEDRHWPACAPTVVPTAGRRKVIDLRGRTLIHAAWLPEDDAAPTWKQWLSAARVAGQSVPEWSAMKHLTFREEAHAIEAAIAGQGLAMCSDVLVAREFANGRLVRFSTLSLPGYGFFVVSLPELALDRRVLASGNGLQGPRRETSLNIGISVSVYRPDQFRRVASAFSATASWLDRCFADPQTGGYFSDARPPNGGVFTFRNRCNSYAFSGYVPA